METNSVLKLTYTQSGDYLIPNITLADFEEEIGRYGRMRRDYLREYHPILYNDLVLSNNLFPHLVEINRTALNRLRIMLPQLKAQHGITEELKAADQMRWVQEMTAIRRIAADPVCDEQHHHLSAQLPTEQRKELLKLIDCHYAHTDQIALESFIVGFRLATGIAKELSGNWYSFEKEEEKRAGKP